MLHVGLIVGRRRADGPVGILEVPRSSEHTQRGRNVPDQPFYKRKGVAIPAAVVVGLAVIGALGNHDESDDRLVSAVSTPTSDVVPLLTAPSSPPAVVSPASTPAAASPEITTPAATTPAAQATSAAPRKTSAAAATSPASPPAEVTSAPSATPAPVAAAPAAKKYTKCADLNVDFPHGVANAADAVDHVSDGGPGVTTFTVDAATYEANKGRLDGDEDGIACEKA